MQRLICDIHPEQLRMNLALWNRGVISQLIEQECGISMPIRTVGHYFRLEVSPRRSGSDAHGRGFAPKGNTPVAYAPGTRKRLPMIANVTDKGYTCWLTPDYRWKF